MWGCVCGVKGAGENAAVQQGARAAKARQGVGKAQRGVKRVRGGKRGRGRKLSETCPNAKRRKCRCSGAGSVQQYTQHAAVMHACSGSGKVKRSVKLFECFLVKPANVHAVRGGDGWVRKESAAKPPISQNSLLSSGHYFKVVAVVLVF